MTALLHSPGQLLAYDPATGRWMPTEHNRYPEWKNRVLCEFIRPDERGISRWVDVEDLKRLYPAQASQFGGNGSNYFTRSSPVTEFVLEARGSSRGITARRTMGLNHSATAAASRGIRPDILRTIRSLPCAVTGSTSGIECDHRSGRYPPSTDKATQHLSEFQPLSKGANTAKRSACQRCIQTRSRFDARILGCPVGWLTGDASSLSCQGCYWHDPAAFFRLVRPEEP